MPASQLRRHLGRPLSLLLALTPVAIAACGSDVGDGATATTTTSAPATDDTLDLAVELERICAAGSQIEDLAEVISTVVPELEALDVDGADQEAVAQILADFDAAQQALEEDRPEEAGGHIEEASARVRELGGECGGPPTESVDLVAADAVIDIGGAIGQVTASGDDVWVADFDGGTVIRVHGPSGEIVTRIEVDDDELRTIQVTAGGVWVRGATGLHRIDPSTNQVAATVPKDQIGANVTRAFVDEAAIWACDGSQLVRADLEGHPTATLDLGFPCGTITSGDGQLWVASDSGPGRWARIDPATTALIFAVDVPVEFATFPAIGGGQVWSHGQSDATEPAYVAVDAATGEVLHTGPLDSGGGPGALTATTYYAPSSDIGQVLGIDRTSGEIVARLDGGTDPNAASISGRSLWVVDDESGRLFRFDL